MNLKEAKERAASWKQNPRIRPVPQVACEVATILADGHDQLLAASRSAIIALAHAAESDSTYQSAYKELDAAIKAAV